MASPKKLQLLLAYPRGTKANGLVKAKLCGLTVPSFVWREGPRPPVFEWALEAAEKIKCRDEFSEVTEFIVRSDPVPDYPYGLGDLAGGFESVRSAVGDLAENMLNVATHIDQTIGELPSYWKPRVSRLGVLVNPWVKAHLYGIWRWQSETLLTVAAAPGREAASVAEGKARGQSARVRIGESPGSFEAEITTGLKAICPVEPTTMLEEIVQNALTIRSMLGSTIEHEVEFAYSSEVVVLQVT